jgi:hypothetical protein
MKSMKRRIGLVVFGLLLALVAVLGGCTAGAGGGVTLSGSVADTGSNPAVGLFDWATYTFFTTTPVDKISSLLGGSPNYTPFQTTTVSGGTYSITLPAGASGATYYLVAWDDVNSNGVMEASGEAATAVFPMKNFPEGLTAMKSISYVTVGSYGEYCAGYYIPSTNYIQGFSIVGTTGYNFNIR